MKIVLRVEKPCSLAEHEEIITSSLHNVETHSNVILSSLLAIKKEKLYLPKWDSFEVYLQERWKRSLSWGYRYLKSLECIDDIQDQVGADFPMPTAESQTRPLGAIEADQRGEVWKEAIEVSGGKVPTAATVKAVVDKRTKPQAPDPEVQPGNDGIFRGLTCDVEVLVCNADAPDPEPKADEVFNPVKVAFGLPIYEVLPERSRTLLVADVVCYYSSREEARQLAKYFADSGGAKRSFRGPFANLTYRFAFAKPPDHWTLCEPCNGEGSTLHPVEGYKMSCPDCYGVGYEIY